MKTPNSANYSLSRRLLLLLLLPLLFGLALAAWATASRIKSEVNQLHDGFLSRSANVFTAFLQYQFAEEAEHGGYSDDDDEEEQEEENEENNNEIAEELLEAVSVIEQQQQVSINYRLTVSGRVVFTSADVATLPACGEGFDTLLVQSSEHANGELWRCFGKAHSVPGSTRQYIAEFFELQAERSKVISSALKSTLLPLIILPFLLLAIAWVSVRQGMREVLLVSKDVGSRSISNLEKLSLHNKPRELVPVLDSVNQLMRKVKTGIEREKQFTDDAAHELRTPITSISMTEQLIRRENTQPELDQLLDQLKKGIGQSEETITQLLRFARLQSQEELVLESQNMNELVQEQLNNHSSSILEKNLNLDFQQLAKTQLSVDTAAMKVAIGNLISNAIKFSPVDSSIHIALDDKGLLIEDEGIGILQKQRERIFDRFYRVPEARSTPGTGLGLALVKWIIDFHGFTIECCEPKMLTGAAFQINWQADDVRKC